MKTPDLDRIRYVTRHLGEFQAGVASGFLGLFLLFSGLGSYSRSLLWILPQMASVAGFLFAMNRGRGYLEARFGRVENKRGLGRIETKKWTASNDVKLAILLSGIIVPACLLGYFLARSASAASFVFDRLFYLVFGAVLLYRFIYREHRLVEAYNLGIAALFLAIATRGAFPALTPPAWLWNHRGMSFILYGSAMVLTSLVDYWQLARTLPPIVEEAEESEGRAAEETR